MSPQLKKRKTLVAAPRKTATPATRGIAAFGRISKPQVQSRLDRQDSKIEKVVYELDTGENHDVTAKRRKLDSFLETPIRQRISQSRATDLKAVEIVSTGTAGAIVKKELSRPPLAPLRPDLVAPHTKLLLKEQLNETPTKGARAYLESFTLAPSSLSVGRSPPLLSLSSTPPTSPISDKGSFPTHKQPADLPNEVQDLIDLHSSFLTALSIYYAHHGSFAPADLRVLAPSIERSWRKRKIHLADLERIFGVSHGGGDDGGSRQEDEAEYPLSLSDYGQGKICVEFCISVKDSTRRHPLNIEALKNQFHESVLHLWSQHPTSDPTTFLTSLPLFPIKPCSSLAKISPLLAIGQRHLEDLIPTTTKTQPSNKSTLPVSSQSTQPKPAISSRKSSLTDRIRAKEKLRQSTLPGAPSPETIARKAALHRLEEVIPVLEILTGSGGSHDQSDTRAGTGAKTISFTMPTIVQHLQASLRNPISKDEAMRCVRLLAGEITPEWVSVKDIRKVHAVMVRKGNGVEREDIRVRVKDALGRSL
ncbi:hypothetical protein MMC14_000788 [Varicellaria rhodocarpa]|nr:hypothetical protein [Varicellaria rhodocarpa]